MDFYNRLNYSLGNEDWHVEEQGLRVKPYDRVVCVTASGDRPLHLLMTDCAEIHAIDMNPIQNYLLELKRAAIFELDFEEYLAFMGGTPSRFRLDSFKKIKSHLSEDALKYWMKHKKSIVRGIIFQGRVERLTKFVAKFILLLRRKEIKTLLSFDDLSLQQKYVATRWDTLWWRKFFDFVLNPSLMKYILNDPGLISYVDPSIKPGNYFYQRMLKYLNHHLAKKSPLIQLILTGKVLPETYFPYLTFPGYQKIRQNPCKLTIETGNVIEHLNQTPNAYDVFSMSDIASYMSQEYFQQLLQGIYLAARPNARFCIRKLMSKHTIAPHLVSSFKRDHSLEDKLEIEESNFVYGFMVGEIIKDQEVALKKA